jgi:hypothetical protein
VAWRDRRVGLVEKVSEATWSESSEKTGPRGEKASGGGNESERGLGLVILRAFWPRSTDRADLGQRERERVLTKQ